MFITNGPSPKCLLARVSFWLITEISLFVDTRIKRESLLPVKTPPYSNVSKTSLLTGKKAGTLIALMFVGSLGLGLTFYGSWHRKKTGQAKCYDEVAVNSLVVNLQKATEAHERNLIDSVNLYTRRNQLLNVLNHLMAQGSNTETCISRELALLGSVYEKGFINEVEWYENRQILWRKLHNLLLANVQSEEEREQALVIIKQLYDQGAINIVELHTTRQKLIEK